MNINEGARIIIQDWLHAEREDVIHLITDETKLKEAKAFEEACAIHGAVLKTTIIPSYEVQSAETIEKMKEIMSYADAIIGATNFSFVTSNAVSYATKKGTKFLSLPLSTNDGTSLLEADFLRMSTRKVKLMAMLPVYKLNRSKRVHITTKLGTDIWFDINNRKAGVFNGATENSGSCASASFEVYIAPNEYRTNGTVVLDGSMGYIGLVKENVRIEFDNGFIKSIEDNESGRKLKDFLESFNDEEMYCAAELGIGLNKLSKCVGRSYIEDESTYSTFHIGMGRNFALGGVHDAKGHFDIVIHKPTIECDGSVIMKDGELKGLFK